MTRRKTGISCFVSKAITESCVRDEWSEDTHDEGKNCYRTHQHIYNKKRRREKGEEEKFCEKKTFSLGLCLWICGMCSMCHSLLVFRRFLISFSFYIKTLCCVWIWGAKWREILSLCVDFWTGLGMRWGGALDSKLQDVNKLLLARCRVTQAQVGIWKLNLLPNWHTHPTLSPFSATFLKCLTSKLSPPFSRSNAQIGNISSGIGGSSPPSELASSRKS